MSSVHEAPRRQAGGVGRFCGQCGAERQVGDRFCRGCGQPLSDAVTHERVVPVAPDGRDPRIRARRNNAGSIAKVLGFTLAGISASLIAI
jgi:predicted amidophosphoribosyltransferase